MRFLERSFLSIRESRVEERVVGYFDFLGLLCLKITVESGSGCSLYVDNGFVVRLLDRWAVNPVGNDGVFPIIDKKL